MRSPNAIFGGLMLAALAASLALPPGVGDRAKASLDALLSPVSHPVRLLAMAVAGRFTSPDADADGPGGAMTPRQLRQENDYLRAQVAAARTQIDDLEKRQGQARPTGIALAGDGCEPFTVIGADAGVRQSMSLLPMNGSSVAHLAAGMAVLDRYGLVGRVQVAGLGTARVQLVTDTGFRVTVGFARLGPSGDHATLERIATAPVALSGDGRGHMHIVQLSMAEVKQYGLAAGDWVLLADHDGWTPAVQGTRLGQIQAIAVQRRHPLAAEITVRPEANLMQLKEVMVAVRQ